MQELFPDSQYLVVLLNKVIANHKLLWEMVSPRDILDIWAKYPN